VLRGYVSRLVMMTTACSVPVKVLEMTATTSIASSTRVEVSSVTAPAAAKAIMLRVTLIHIPSRTRVGR